MDLSQHGRKYQREHKSDFFATTYEETIIAKCLVVYVQDMNTGFSLSDSEMYNQTP